MYIDNFYLPKSLAQLAEALEKKDGDTYIVAGGTDLVINFSKNGIFDYKLIDITHIKELKAIEETQYEVIIGACVTMTEIENSPVIDKYISALKTAAYKLGSQQIRNRATIGGNISNSSQSADTLPVLFAYGAEVEIINSKGQKRIDKVENVVIGLGKNNLQKDEVITKIIIKKCSSISAFAKIGSRTSVTISKVNCCLKVDTDIEGKIANPVIYLGAVGPKPIKAQLIEKALADKNIKTISICEIKEQILDQIEAAIPNRSSKHYKKEASAGIIEEALNNLK